MAKNKEKCPECGKEYVNLSAHMRVHEDKETEKETKEEETKKPRELLSMDDFDYSEMVNMQKIERTYKAMVGEAKPMSAEIKLLKEGKVEGKDGQELFEHIYKGLGGLIDASKAKINRENEKKKAAARASR